MRYKILSWLNDLWYLHLRLVCAVLFFNLAKIFWLVGVQNRAAKFCMASIRYSGGSKAIFLLKKITSTNAPLARGISTGVAIKEAAARSIIIKWPTYQAGAIDKGVIVVTFTKTFSYFLRNIDLDEMSKHFIFVLEPSWSGYADPDILGFHGRLNNVIIEASEVEDRVLLNCFPETFVPVSFGASDWVDSDIFIDTGAAKIYDSIYISNTNPIKRIKRYIDAVKQIVAMGNSNYVGCLVCAAWGGAEALILEMVNQYQLKDNIVLKFSLNREQVIDALNKSKVNILLSYKEGSNRSLFEAMFCNVPVICLSENVGVNKAYVNEFTGLLVPDKMLEGALIWIGENYRQFCARNWAMENISPPSTTRKLSQLLFARNLMVDNETSKIFVKTNNPEVSYFQCQSLDHKKYSEDILSLFELRPKQTKLDYSAMVNDISKLFNAARAQLEFKRQ